MGKWPQRVDIKYAGLTSATRRSIQFFLEKEDTPGVVGDPPCQQIERLSQALVVGGNPPFETPQNYQQSALSGAQCAPEMKKIKKEFTNISHI